MFRNLVVFTLGGLGAFAADAAAKDLVVAPSGAPFTSIQAAVDAAGPKDTVVVKPGRYSEAVDVPMGKEGLRIRALPGAILDARTSAGAALGPGLHVLADGVLVSGLTIEHAASNGEAGRGVYVQAAGVTLRRVTVRHAQVDGMRIDGEGARVLQCRVLASGGGIDVVSEGALLSGNRITNVGGLGLRVIGTGARIERNRVQGAAGDGIDVLGDGARVKGNRIENGGGAGIDVTGDDVLIAGNRIESVLGIGIDLNSKVAHVTGNRVRFPHDVGMIFEVNAIVARDNHVEDVIDDSAGVVVSSAEGHLERNRVTGASGQGIVIEPDCLEFQVNGNVVRASGFEREASFEVEGAYTAVFDNAALDGGGDGFRLHGLELLVVGNRAIGLARDGFDVDSDATVLRENVAKRCLGEGVDVGALDTELVKNVLKQNRIDLAGGNGVAVLEGNSFGSGGAATLPEID